MCRHKTSRTLIELSFTQILVMVIIITITVLILTATVGNNNNMTSGRKGESQRCVMAEPVHYSHRTNYRNHIRTPE